MSDKNSVLSEFMKSEFVKKNLEKMKKEGQYPSGAEGLPEETKGWDVPDLDFKGTEKGADAHFESLSEAQAQDLAIAQKDPAGNNDAGLKAAGKDKKPTKKAEAEESEEEENEEEKSEEEEIKEAKDKSKMTKKAEILIALQKVADLVDKKALEKFEAGKNEEAAELMEIANELDEVMKSEVEGEAENTEEKVVEAKRKRPKMQEMQENVC